MLWVSLAPRAAPVGIYEPKEKEATRKQNLPEYGSHVKVVVPAHVHTRNVQWVVECY